MADNDILRISIAIDEVKQMPAVSLAFIGDAVYDLYIRNLFVSRYPRAKSNKLNAMKVKCVNAAMQAKIARALLPLLSEEEEAVLRRGRNAKMATMAKNATVGDYKYATGFEALIGYLHVGGCNARLAEVLALAFAECQRVHNFDKFNEGVRGEAVKTK